MVDDVPSGNYELDIQLWESPADPLNNDRYMPSGREIGVLRMAVTIPDTPADGVDEPFDLGALTVELKSQSQSRK